MIKIFMVLDNHIKNICKVRSSSKYIYGVRESSKYIYVVR